jgi:hypothetical protein
MPVVPILLLVASTLMGSQTATPNFSGAWTMDPAKSASVGGGQGGGRGTGGGLGLGPSPDRVVIKQDANTIAVEEHRGTDTATISYRLDGKSVSNTMPVGRNAGKSADYVSHWDGDKLVTTIDAPGAPGSSDRVRYRETRSLDRGGAMVVEMTIPGQDNARKVVYTRKPDEPR